MSRSKHTDGQDVIAWEEALDRVDGSRETLDELVDIFLEQWPQMMDEIERGVARRDRDLLRRAAHTLKGSASIFSAQPVARAAGRLSKMAQSDELDDAEQALRELQDEMDRLVPVLQRGA